MSKYLILRTFAFLSILSIFSWSLAQDTSQTAIRLLERMDRDGDGRLTPDEIPAQSKAAVERLAKEAGISDRASISISKLKKKIEKERRSEERKERRESKSSSNEDDSRPESKRSSGFGASESNTRTTTATSSGFGASSGSSRDPKVRSYVDSLFKSSDKNRNGYIDGKEIETIRTRDNPRDWDRNKDGKLSRSEVTLSISERSTRRSTSASSSRSSTPSTTTRSTASRRSSSGDRYRRYAESLVKRYDSDKDGYLKKDEWERVRNAAEADKNRDGILTVDELTNHLKEMSAPRSRSTESQSSSRSASRRSSERRSSRGADERPKRDPSEPRRSYRALTAHERLPSGLPDWFTDRDENANGQIEMSEYSSSWSDSKVEEFQKLDANNDGVITAAECLKNG